MTADRLLTPPEAAELLGVTVSTLNCWRTEQRGPAFIRVSSRCVRYRLSDLNLFADARRVVGVEAARLEGEAVTT